jgi:hypothetical protein
MELPIHIKVNIRQASFFAIMPDYQSSNYTLKWHNGNIYDLPNSPAQIIELPHLPYADKPTMYHLIISADSEIRLFGDPLDVDGQEAPIQRIMIDISISDDSVNAPVSIDRRLFVSPDFVDGWALSEGAFGIGIICHKGWWEVSKIRVDTTVCAALRHRSFLILMTGIQSHEEVSSYTNRTFSDSHITSTFAARRCILGQSCSSCDYIPSC